MNVLVIGKPKYNVILESESYPVENSKNSINEKIEITGGFSCYVACMLAKWGIPVSFIGLINGDELGNKIKTELESFGVETKFIETEYEHHTSINYVLLNKANGSSTEVLHDNGVFLTRYKYDINPDYIITDGSDMGASIAALNNYPKARMILLANKVSREYIDLSKRCAYVCANMNFAAALTKMEYDYNKPKSLVELFQKIKDLNKAEYIIMLGKKGVLYNKERQVKLIPSIEVEKKDDTNSGPSFFASYCYGILKGLDMDTIAKTSNIAGALALTKVGTLNTIPTKEEVFEMAGIDETKLKTSVEASSEPQVTQTNQTVTPTEVKPEVQPVEQPVQSAPVQPQQAEQPVQTATQAVNPEPIPNPVPNQNPNPTVIPGNPTNNQAPTPVNNTVEMPKTNEETTNEIL